MLTVTLLGTGGPVPDPNRAGPATLVAGGSEQYLVDARRGVLMRLAAVGSGPAQLSAVLLTHLHNDHITDLNDVITTRWVMTFEPAPLTIVGPVGTRQVVDRILESLGPDIAYRTTHHQDLDYPPPVEVTEGETDLGAGVRVTCAPTDHKPVEPTVAFRFDYGGSSVAAAGDTVPCPGLDRLCKGAQALVHTVIRKDIIATIPSSACSTHSTTTPRPERPPRPRPGPECRRWCSPTTSRRSLPGRGTSTAPSPPSTSTAPSRSATTSTASTLARESTG